MAVYSTYINELFKDASYPRGWLGINPVTGSEFIRGIDPIGPQKKRAEKAWKARAWFELQRPFDVAELPLSYAERETLKKGGVNHILGWYADSVRGNDYEIELHPDFELYARGVMASPFAPNFIKQDPGLLRRYPPLELPGLGRGLIWQAQQ